MTPNAPIPRSTLALGACGPRFGVHFTPASVTRDGDGTRAADADPCPKILRFEPA